MMRSHPMYISMPQYLASMPAPTEIISRICGCSPHLSPSPSPYNYNNISIATFHLIILILSPLIDRNLKTRDDNGQTSQQKANSKSA